MKADTNNELRELIAQAGITVDNVTPKQLNSLHKHLSFTLADSDCYKGTYRMNSKIGRYMTCCTEQWDSREAVSFNGDGFIGFAGWSDSTNIKPIREGVINWLEEMGGSA